MDRSLVPSGRIWFCVPLRARGECMAYGALFRRSVAALMLVMVIELLSWPGAACTLLARRAAAISPADSLRAASLSGSIQMRRASV